MYDFLQKHYDFYVTLLRNDLDPERTDVYLAMLANLNYLLDQSCLIDRALSDKPL